MNSGEEFEQALDELSDGVDCLLVLASGDPVRQGQLLKVITDGVARALAMAGDGHTERLAGLVETVTGQIVRDSVEKSFKIHKERHEA